VSARGFASLIRLIPDDVLAINGDCSLQDISIVVVDIHHVVDMFNARAIDNQHFALVKDAAAVAPDCCNGDSASNRMLIQVSSRTYTLSVN
jgi:hypothetical protein